MKVATQIERVLECMNVKHQKIFQEELPVWVTDGKCKVLIDWVVESSGTMTRSVAALEKTEPKRWIAFGISKNYLIFKMQVRSEDRIYVSDPLILNKVPKDIVCFMEQKMIPSFETSRITIYTPLHQKHPGLCEYALMGMVEIDGQEFIIVSDQKNPMSCINWTVLPINFEKRICWQNGLSLDRKWFNDFLLSDVNEQVAISSDVFAKKINCEKMEIKGAVWHWVFQPDNDKEKVPKLIRKFKLGEFLF